MKITPSLKLYFIGVMFITGASTILVMSAVSMHYFFQGVDFSMEKSMHEQVSKHELQGGKAIQVDHFTIASRWEDLPQPIKENLSEGELKKGQLLKKIDGFPLFSEPKAGYFAMRVMNNGEVRYISSMFSSEMNQQFPPKSPKNRPNQFLFIIFIGLMGIIIFSFLPYLILRRVTVPVQKLMLWAKKLDKEKLSQSVPNFHYSELNSLATMMQESLQSVKEAQDREQRFLGYASHELRTPIAVTRTNTELLRKMMEKNIHVNKQEKVLDRIDRACLTMTDLTETLLWLNREPNKLIPVKPLAIGKLTQQIIEELSYIHDEKAVTLSQETDAICYTLPEPLCRIIISNLIRNAFQHTQQGSVTIKQSESIFIIINQNTCLKQNTQQGSINEKGDSELGFGLGLELTKRLVEHYGWKYSNIANDNGHHVEINFSK